MRIPILMYHSVEPRSTDYLTVSVDRFRRHIAHLSRRYTLVCPRDLTAHPAVKGLCAAQTPIVPKDALSISFDDALQSAFRYAVPILQRYSATAIFFIIAGAIGKTNRWDHKADRILQHMRCSELESLHAHGFELGSHTLSHQRLTKLSINEIDLEFRRSASIIAKITGASPLSLSYPYGAADSRCLKLCRRYYSFGFTTVRQGVFDWNRQPTNIRRIYVSPEDSPDALDRKIECYRNGVQHE